MKYAIIKNVPKNPNKLFKEAISKSFNWWIDEKGTKDNPGVWKREPSKLTYEQAFEIIQNNKPHWVISFRNVSSIYNEEDYWDFGGCNIGINDYGEVFIWIQVKVDVAEELFKKYKLEKNEY